MELQFQKKSMPCIRELTSQLKHQELTQEVRLPEGMPDIGRVICTWGQVLIRGKEWRQDSIGVSGGLMVWILYKPESEDGCKVVETWLPFNTKADISGAERDGSIITSGKICYQDVRSVSARKFMLRIGICVDIQVYTPSDVCIYNDENIPEHILLKKSVYPLRVPAEIGEKAFSLEEELPLPDNSPELLRIIRYELSPEIVELKVLGSRLVFRGIAQAHVLYEGADNKLYSYDVQLPFSQFTELDSEYEEEADAGLWPVVTNLEVTIDDKNVPFLKAGMAGQYIIYNTQMVEIIEDAYSTSFDSEVQLEQLQLPVILQEHSQRIKAEAIADIQAESVVDTEFISYALNDRFTNEGDIEGRFYILFYDQDGELQCAHLKWEHQLCDEVLNLNENSIRLTPVGQVQTKNTGSIIAQCDVKVDSVCKASRGLVIVSGLIMEEKEHQDDKPSLVLKRAGEEDLWTLAKMNGSSVEAIRAANGITEVHDPNLVLIIPVM